jgi:hypothetical protein
VAVESGFGVFVFLLARALRRYLGQICFEVGMGAEIAKRFEV